MNIQQELDALFEGEITQNDDQLARYSHDASIFEVRPLMILYPEHAHDIQAAVRFVLDKKKAGVNLSLTPRAAGTCMSGGSLSESLILDVTRHMNKIGEISNETITAEPGAFYRDFERKTAAKERILPSYTASKEICTVGGMVGNNAGGEKSLVYGNTSRFVRSVTAVLSNGDIATFGSLSKEALEEKKKLPTFEGELYRKTDALIEANRSTIDRARPRVSKNSAGYLLWDVWDGEIFNLAKLFAGSQGTLGILTEITFDLVPKKRHTQMLVATLKNLDSLPRIINTVLAKQPESFEAYDDHTFMLAKKYMPEISEKVISEKDILLTLIAEFTGETPEEARAKAAEAHELLGELPANSILTSGEEEAEPYWKIRRSSFRLLRDHSEGEHRVAPFIDDIIVPPGQLSAFLPRLRAILEKYNFTYTLAGHIGNGNFHIIPLVNMCDEKNRASIVDLAQEVFSLTFAHGGSMAGEHNDGIIRTPFIQQMFGKEIYRLFEETKRIFDPFTIFNPGKKTGGTLEYAVEHFSKTNFCEHL